MFVILKLTLQQRHDNHLQSRRKQDLSDVHSCFVAPDYYQTPPIITAFYRAAFRLGRRSECPRLRLTLAFLPGFRCANGAVQKILALPKVEDKNAGVSHPSLGCC